MPQFLAYETLADQLIADMVEVWGLKKVHLGWPVTKPKTYPYGAIALSEDEFLPQANDAGVIGYWQRPQIMLSGRFIMPSPSEGIQRVQVAKANLLIARLEAATIYPPTPGTAVVQDTVATIGPLPSPMTDTDKNHFYEVNVLFTPRVRELHTSKL